MEALKHFWRAGGHLPALRPGHPRQDGAAAPKPR